MKGILLLKTREVSGNRMSQLHLQMFKAIRSVCLEAAVVPQKLEALKWWVHLADDWPCQWVRMMTADATLFTVLRISFVTANLICYNNYK